MKTGNFRRLTENEWNLIRKMADRGEAGDWLDHVTDYTGVAYRYQSLHGEPDEEFTIALLSVTMNGDGPVMLAGSTKKHRDDPPNRIRGQMEALKRAVASDFGVRATAID